VFNQQHVGWPRRPGRAAGSRNDKKPHRTRAIGPEPPRRNRLSAATRGWAFLRTVEPAGRGFVSLRDPAGASHTAGPPKPTLGLSNLRMSSFPGLSAPASDYPW